MKTAINKAIDTYLGGVLDTQTFRVSLLSCAGFSAIILAMAAIILPHQSYLAIEKSVSLNKPLSVTSLTMTDAKKEPQLDIATEDAVAGLHESGPHGFLPIKRADGQTIFDAYRAAFTSESPPDQQTTLFIYDVGLSGKTTNELMNSAPPHTTFIVSPYADNVQKTITEARSKGFEVWLFVPLEPKDFAVNDTGPRTLRLNSSLDENNKNLLDTLGMATGYTGIVTDENTVFAQNETAYKQFQDTLTARGIEHYKLDMSSSTSEKGIVLPLTKGTLTQLPMIANDITTAQKIIAPLSYRIKPTS